MSDISESTYPESTAGPASPIFGTASFSTFTTTALTSLWPPSSNRNSRSGSSCGSDNEGSEAVTYQDEESVAATEEDEGAIGLVADEVSNIDDDYEDRSQVSTSEQATQLSSSTTLSASYHIRSATEDYTSTPTRDSSYNSYGRPITPIYTHSHHHSSSDLGNTLSRTTLTPTYTGTTPHSRSYAPSSTSSRSGQGQLAAAAARRTTGQLVAFFEDKAHSRAASAPMESPYSRPSSPVKPMSASHSLPVAMPGSMPQTRSSDALSWRSGGKTLSSWSFGSGRSRSRTASPTKGTSETGSAVSGSAISGSTGYTRSGYSQGGYVSGFVGAIGGLVGFSSSSSSRMSTASRSPPRRRPSPSSPRRRERTASSPRSAFSQQRRSPRSKGKERERYSPSPSRAKSLASEAESVEEEGEDEDEEDEEPEVRVHEPAMVSPPLNFAEYGGKGEPIIAAPVWYYNVHRLEPYTWNYAEGYLFPHMLLLSWIAPTGGRVVVKLDLLSCVEIRTSRPQERGDVYVEREGQSHRLQSFELGYGDSIERLGCETRPEMLDWFNSIQKVFNGIISLTESEKSNRQAESPAPTISSFDFSESVISSQLQSAPASISQSVHSRHRPRTPVVPLTEGVLRSQTPPIDTTVHMWRTLALEKDSASSEVSSVVEEPLRPSVETVQTTSSRVSRPLTQSQASRSFLPSSASDSLTKTLTSGTLSAGARTILEIGSSTGTDIVASTLSFRGTASASLLGDSCGPGSSFETSSTAYDGRRYRQQTTPSAQTQSGSASGYRAEVHEPRNTDSKSHEVPQAPPNPPQHAPQDRGASDELMDSPEGQVSDSDDYVTATSPSTSFVSLSGMSAFPDDDEVDERPSDEPFLPEPVLDVVEPAPEAPPTPAAFSEIEVQTIQPEDDPSTLAPMPIEEETVRDDQSKDSDVSTPVVAVRDLTEQEAPAVETTQPVPAPRHVDACTQADVIESPIKHDTPLPAQIPLPLPADTVYSPAAESVRLTPLGPFEALQPEVNIEVPGSPQSDVLSALSLVVPSLAKLPSVVDAVVEEQSFGTVLASLNIIAESPVPSLAYAPSPSTLQATPQMGVPSPSVVDSNWPSETDESYDSSVLDASPSLLSESRTLTEYAGVAESPAVSDAQIAASTLLRTPTKLASVIREQDAGPMASEVEMDSEMSSTPTASSWVSSLPPSVPSNTLNEENGSVALDFASASYAASLHGGTSVFEPLARDQDAVEPKTFAEEGCQVDLVTQKYMVSPRMIPLPMSRPPSRRSVSVGALRETTESGTIMDGHGLKVQLTEEHMNDVAAHLSAAFTNGSDKIVDRLSGMGEVLTRDHEELRNMLAELLSTSRLQESKLVDDGFSSTSVLAEVGPSVSKVDVATSPILSAFQVDFATSPILAAVVHASTSPPPISWKECATSPVAVTKYREMDVGPSVPLQKHSVDAIFLTPPPRHAASPDTLLETMSYLSSHHSDDLSEMDLDMDAANLQLERVSTVWSSPASDASTHLTLSSHGEEAGMEMDYVPSRAQSYAHRSVVSMHTQADGTVIYENRSVMVDRATEQDALSYAGRDNTLELLPGTPARSASGGPQESILQMPTPVRAGMPFTGQLADLLVADSEIHSQHPLAAPVEAKPIYSDQATSPVIAVDELQSLEAAKPELVDKEVDGVVSETKPVYSDQASSPVIELSPLEETKLDLVDKEVDQTVLGTTPIYFDQASSPLLLAAEPLNAQDEVSDRDGGTIVSEAIPVYAEQGVSPVLDDTQPLPSASTESQLLSEDVGSIVSEAKPTYSDQASSPVLADDLPLTPVPATRELIDKEVDSVAPDVTVPDLVYSDQGVDVAADKSIAYVEQMCDTADLSESSSESSLDEPQELEVVEAVETAVKEIQSHNLPEPNVDFKHAFMDAGTPMAPQIMAFPSFVPNHDALASQVSDFVKSGISPALHDISSLIKDNRIGFDEYRDLHDGYRRVHEESVMQVHEKYMKVHEESVMQLHEGYRKVRDETMIQVQEMYRLAQDEIRNSVEQIKAIVMQALSTQSPGSLGVSGLPQPQAYQTPPGFVPFTGPAPLMAQPVFMPTPQVMQYTSPLTPALFPQDRAVIPSPPPMSDSTVSDGERTPGARSVVLDPPLNLNNEYFAPPPITPMAPSSVFQAAGVPLPPTPAVSTSQVHQRDLTPFVAEQTLAEEPECVVPEFVPFEPPVAAQPIETTESTESTDATVETKEMDDVTPVVPLCETSPTEAPTEAAAPPEVETASEKAVDQSVSMSPPVDAPVTEAENIVPIEVEEHSSSDPPTSVDASPEPDVDVIHAELTVPSDTPHHSPAVIVDSVPETETFSTPDAQVDDLPQVDADHADREVVFDDVESSSSEMSGFTTPLRPQSPAEHVSEQPPAPKTADDVVEDPVHDGAHNAEESHVDPTEQLADPSPPVAPVDQDRALDSEAIVIPTPAEHFDLKSSVETAASELRSVVEAVQHAAEGALTASKEAQAMLESVRSQREEYSREVHECTREREAARADREEARALRERAVVEAAAERERDIAEKESRISELQTELDSIRAREVEQETSRTEALSERDSRIQALEEELATVRSELEHEKEARSAEQAERQANDEERDRQHAELEAERESRISSLEQELASLREEQEKEHEARAAQEAQWHTEREELLAEATSLREQETSERDARIKVLEEEMENMRAEQEEARQKLEAEELERAEALAARETAFNESTAERDARVQALEEELATLRADTERERAEHEAALAEHQAKIDSHQAAIEEHQATIDECRAAIAEHEATIAERQATITEHEATIAEQQGTIVGHEGTISEQQGTITGQQETMAELEGKIAEQQETIAEQQGTIAGQQEAMTELEGRVAEQQETITEQEGTISGREAAVTELEGKIAEQQAIIEEQQTQIAAHQAAIEEQQASQEEQTKVHEEQIQERQLLIEEREGRIVALEEELDALRAERDAEYERRDLELAESKAAWEERENALLEAEAERDAKIATLEGQLADLQAEHEQKEQERDAKDVERQTVWDEKAQALEDAAAERDSRIAALEEDLSALRAEREQEKQQRETEEAERVQRDLETAEAALERERLSSERHDARIKELTDELAALRAEREEDKQQRLTEEAERREADRAEVRQLAETQNMQLTEIQDKLTKLTDQSSEQFTNVDGRFDKITEASTEQFAALNAQLEKLEQGAVQDRELHEAEKAEAAAKPSVESLFEVHMSELREQVQKQIATLENDIKAEGSRQHEEVIANVRSTIEEQSALLVTTCLDELGKLLESIGAQQQAEILSAMRVAIQEQVTFNISYYLDELTKMFDSHGVRHLAETIDAVRATAREQVEFNSDNHLTDFCKNLAPEMLQLFQEIKEKAEEKSRLDRQIDILRRHKHDYEAGDLRGEEFDEAPAIHASRSDADLHKAWRGRARPPRRQDDAGPDVMYAQPTGPHPPIYPDHAPQWSHDSFDQMSRGEMALIPPPLDDPLFSNSRTPNASFYRG